jgi:membrane-bound serine protease (ClpP class)
MIVQAIIVLVVVGFLMIAAEVCLPGLILGILGTLCLLTAVFLCYMAFGPLMGTLAFAALVLLGLVGFFLWLKYFPTSRIGRKILLHKSLETNNALPACELVGQIGESLTPLRPAGTALVDGRRRDVVAESGLIEAGAKVLVVAQEGIRIVVRKQEP